MATRGAKPKPAALRLVDGTHRRTRHGDPAAVVSTTEIDGLSRPAFLRGEAKKAWDEWIAPFPWIDRTRAPAAIAFCTLWAEFRDMGTHFPAAKHGQMRAYMSDLGLTDERNRKGADGKAKDPADAYF